MPGLAPFVQVANGLVIIDHRNVRRVFVIGLDDQAKVEVLAVFNPFFFNSASAISIAV